MVLTLGGELGCKTKVFYDCIKNLGIKTDSMLMPKSSLSGTERVYCTSALEQLNREEKSKILNTTTQRSYLMKASNNRISFE